MAAVAKPHVLAVPLPVQGHVRPLMKLCRQIADLGVKVTFVNTEYIHCKLVVAASSSSSSSSSSTTTIMSHDDNFVLTTIPDGLPPEDDRTDIRNMLLSVRMTMADHLTDLIDKINGSNKNEKISCVIADFSVCWVLEVAKKVGAQAAVFAPSSAAALALMLEIPTLIQQGHLDLNGSIVKERDAISLSRDIPAWRENDVSWRSATDLKDQKTYFRWITTCGRIANGVNLLLCNTSYELESSACNLAPNILPIVPFLETFTNSSSFYHEDASCISWLNDKQTASVIYVSFGSMAVFSQRQIAELALGLELSGRPFLWVVRSDLAKYGSPVKYPDGFLERSSMVGKIVEWAPQEKVLSHPSIACFLSHCGWNSTLEGLKNGVPFLCWPYEVDQFHNRNYICDKWGNGIEVGDQNDGVRTRHEIKTKIDMLFSSYHNLKVNALTLKATIVKSVHQGGSSSTNLQKFIDHLKIGPLHKILISKF